MQLLWMRIILLTGGLLALSSIGWTLPIRVSDSLHFCTNKHNKEVVATATDQLERYLVTTNFDEAMQLVPLLVDALQTITVSAGKCLITGITDSQQLNRLFNEHSEMVLSLRSAQTALSDKWPEEFADIKQQMTVNRHSQIGFVAVAEKLVASLSQDFNQRLLSSTAGEVQQIQNKRFMTHYMHSYDALSLKLYHYLLDPNVLQALEQFTHSRRQILGFFKNTLKLLLTSLSLEMNFAWMQYGEDAVYHLNLPLWRQQLGKVSDYLLVLDNRLKADFYKRASDDLKMLMANNTHLTNSQFVECADKYFNQEYNWLVWFVLGFDLIEDNGHAAYGCNTIFHQDKVRKVSITSINSKEVDPNLEGIQTRTNVILETYEMKPTESVGSRDLLNKLIEDMETSNCNPHKVIHVILAERTTPWFMAPARHFSFRQLPVRLPTSSSLSHYFVLVFY